MTNIFISLQIVVSETLGITFICSNPGFGTAYTLSYNFQFLMLVCLFFVS